MSCVLIRPTTEGAKYTATKMCVNKIACYRGFIEFFRLYTGSVFKVPILDTSPNKGKFVGWLVDITTYSQKLKLNDHFFQV